MILLPIGRDDAVIQRHAWVSYAIIALNVLAFIATGFAERSVSAQQASKKWETTMEYYVAHPYLRVPPNLEMFVPDEVRQAVSTAKRPAILLQSRVREEQQELDRLGEDLTEAYHAIPSIRFGYQPGAGNWLNILTSMFVHADLMHLLGNMLFFFVTAPFIEDVFGRPIFTFLYFTGGVVAAIGYASKHPDSLIPLVGASGAIAAIMGAYLARFFRSKVEFIWVPFLFRPMWHFRFFMPAFVVLPLWFGEQWWASTTAETTSGAGVAFSAHVFGFVYGFFVALLIKWTKIEEKYVAPAVQKQVSWTADPRFTRAVEAQAAGDVVTAKRELASLLAVEQNVGALQMMVDIAAASEDWPAIDNYGARLLARFIEDHDDHAALDLINRFASSRHALPPIPRFLRRAAQFARRSNDHEWADRLTLDSRSSDIT